VKGVFEVEDVNSLVDDAKAALTKDGPELKTSNADDVASVDGQTSSRRDDECA
jgi:hypothetical protein